MTGRKTTGWAGAVMSNQMRMRGRSARGRPGARVPSRPVRTRASPPGGPVFYPEGVDESTVERLIRKARAEEADMGRPLSSRARQSARSVEAYLKAGHRPRWMERLSEIERAIRAERQRLEQAHRRLCEECGADRAAFAERWRAFASAQRYDDL